MEDQNIAVVIERLNNIKETNSKEHNSLKEHFNSVAIEHEKTLMKHDQRIQLIENWKIGFVAKFSVYSAIALFLGSIASSLAIKFIGKYL